MLAIITTQQLSLVDPQALRRPPSSLPSCLSLLAPCTASAWSPDNLYLFLSSPNTIHQYNPALNTLADIYTSPESIAHLVCKTKSSLAFATADKVHLLEGTKIIQTFDSHKAPITSLALSNELLASTSAGAAHVHNLLLGSHTVLRGLNLAGHRITTCAFHPHSRTRLLLGVGKQLLVYDTTRPSGPLKAIPMHDASTGDIVSVACSPFSKTLVAVASASGNVGLVDLDKEKALFRTLSLKVPLTSIAFSPEGASIYLGTEHGKLLIMDLRALDKPPKTVVVSDSGCRVETMTVQKKSKGSTESVTKPTATGTKVSGSGEGSNPARRASAVAATVASAKTLPKATSSPSKGRTARSGSGASPVRRSSALPTQQRVALSPRTVPDANPKIFSPIRDPQGNSTRLGIGQLPSSKNTESTSAGPMLSRLSATSRTRKTSTTESTSARFAAAVVEPDARPRTVSSTSRLVVESISTKSARSRSGSSASRPGSSASQRSSVPPVPSLPASFAVRLDSRTPSPDLPSVNADPVTPLPIGKKGPAIGTPELTRWIEAGDNRSKGHGKGKGKTVIFKDGNDENLPEEGVRERERERSLSMQISPRRPSSVGLNSASWAPSPLRNAIPTSPASGSTSAHDLLRTIVRDVMVDFQQEQRSEMVGLHLDLLKMGRGWKKELRELMDEYVGDLRELREENQRLRAENEHLRRGY
ncbi:WD40-repeat-containing domain protein [Mycena vulgaris]|nr:WD40-repeat-containing domain protein [Mycena vulgaris]